MTDQMLILVSDLMAGLIGFLLGLTVYAVTRAR